MAQRGKGVPAWQVVVLWAEFATATTIESNKNGELIAVIELVAFD